MLLLSIILQTAAYLYCTPPGCTNCTQGVLYQRFRCVPFCPSPNDKLSNPCNLQSNNEVFDVSFKDFKNFSASTISSFLTPNELPFDHYSKQGPMPRIDQGFYFTRNSSLKYNYTVLLGPDFMFHVSGIFKRPGELFEIRSSNSSYLKAFLNDSHIKIKVLLVYSNESLTPPNNLLEKTLEIEYNQTSWESIYFRIIHYPSGSLEFTITNRNRNTRFAFNSIEFMPPNTEVEILLGSQTNYGFEGFLLRAKFTIGTLEFLYNINFREICLCDYNQYCDQTGVCQNCSTSCNSTWPWCLHSNCSYCYSSSCSKCSTYLFSGCEECFDISKASPDCDCGLNCNTCITTFNCSTCLADFESVDGKCLLPVYNLNKVAFNYTFQTFEQYKGDLLQSGQSPLTYFPLNHEIDDPWILELRGAYLNKTRFFVSKADVNFRLNYQFCMSAWILGSVFIDFDDFRVDNINEFEFELWSKEIVLRETVLFYAVIKSYWNFMNICCKFKDNSTTLAYSLNKGITSAYSYEGYVFMSTGTSFKISSGSNGLIYYLMISQYLLDISKNYLDYYPGVDCNYYQYWNQYLKACIECNPGYINICNAWASTSVCKYPDCLSCNSSTESCTRNTIAPICLNNTIYKDDRCCFNLCQSCFERSDFSCLSCINSYKLLGETCVLICPTGFTSDSKSCIPPKSAIINVIFDKILFEFEDSSAFNNLVKAGSENVEYPNISLSHPRPAYLRGFYFLPESYVKIENIALSYNFTVVFIVKPISDGNLFTKGKFKVTLSSGWLNVYDGKCNCISSLSSYVRDQWTVVEVMFSGTINNIQRIQTKVSGGSLSSTYYDGISMQDLSEPVVLGFETQSFTGFLWRFTLYNTAEKITFSIKTCSSTTNIDCLSPCNLLDYFENSCKPCNNCPLGCVRSGSCELCRNPLCLTCTDFISSCLSCKANSIMKKGTCSCIQGYYFNNITNTCDVCINNCMACTSLEDCQCFNNTHRQDLRCVCNIHYWTDFNETCSLCHPWCEGCTIDKFFRCTSCSNFLLVSVCVNRCPLGYTTIENTCHDEDGGISLKFTFERLDGNFSSNEVFMICGKSEKFYPELDSGDPWPAYKRGIFFQQGKFCRFPFKSFEYLLGVRFGISFWVQMNRFEGEVFTGYNSNKLILEVFLGEQDVKMKIFLESLYEKGFVYQAELNTWMFLLVNVEYDVRTMISLGINREISSYFSLSEFPFNSTEKTQFFLGSDLNHDSSFHGYIFELSIYKAPQILSRLVDHSDCFSNVDSQNCFSSCDLLSFPENSSCYSCQDKCVKGCVSNTTCNLCQDINCYQCQDYEKESCINCHENFMAFKGICVDKCKEKQYFDEKLLKCNYCPDLCETCQSLDVCFNCSQNARLNHFELCECLQGFQGKENCLRIFFNASLKLTTEDIPVIVFSEKLNEMLTNDDLNVSIQNVSVGFRVYSDDMVEFRIVIDIKNDILVRDQLLITFNSEITSKNNSLLKTKSLTAQLFPYSISPSIPNVQLIKKSASTATVILNSISLGLSIINFDIRSFLDLRNAAEMFSVIVLFDQPLDDSLLAYLSQIHESSTLPSYLEAVIPDPKSVKLPEKLRNYGYKSNLLLLNCGMHFMTFSLLLAVYIPAKIVHLIKENGFTRKIMNYLEFDAFFKLWTQGFLEVSICSLLGIMSTEFSSSMEIFDLTVCFVMLVFDIQVINMFGIGFLGYLIRKYSRIRDEDKTKKFLQYFGNFFNEFKPNGLCLYYLLFTLRRLGILVLFLFVKEGIIMICLMVGLSTWTFVYVVFSNSHLDKFNMIFLLASELGLSIFHWMIITKFCIGVNFSSYWIIGVVSLTLAINPLLGIAKAISRVARWIRERKYKVNTTDMKCEEDNRNIWVKRSTSTIFTKPN